MKKTRNTKQKSLLMEILKDNHAHPTADEVFMLAREQNPMISRGTVYRDLNQLADMGLIRRVSSTGGPDHYDCRTDKHYHFICRVCGSMFDLPIPYRQSLNTTPPAMEGFVTESHRLLLEGLCPKCAKAIRHEEQNKQQKPQTKGVQQCEA